MNFPFLTFCKMFIMDANEYDAIRGYLLTNVIPPEIKSDHSRISTHSCNCLLFDQVCNRSTTQDQDHKRNRGCLQEIYLTFGVPKILQHDQGPEFLMFIVIDAIVTFFIVFSLEIGVPRIPQETRSRYQKNHPLSSTE